MHNEFYFDVDSSKACYVEYGTLNDILYTIGENFERGEYATVILDGSPVLTWYGPDEVRIHNRDLNFELTHWETNASWWYRGVGDDDNYGEYRVIGTYDNEDDALKQVKWLIANCKELVADDIAMFDADAITLDVRPCGCYTFDHSIDVYPDGTTSGLY